MAHLIQPLDVDGITYCVAYNGNRSTEVVNTEIVSTPTGLATILDPAGEFYMPIDGVASAFEVSYGVGCGSEIEMEFVITADSEEWEFTVDAHINGNVTPAVSLSKTDADGSGTYPFTISISDVPCGSVITLVSNLLTDGTGDITVTGYILSIT